MYICLLWGGAQGFGQHPAVLLAHLHTSCTRHETLRFKAPTEEIPQRVAQDQEVILALCGQLALGVSNIVLKKLSKLLYLLYYIMLYYIILYYIILCYIILYYIILYYIILCYIRLYYIILYIYYNIILYI